MPALFALPTISCVEKKPAQLLDYAPPPKRDPNWWWWIVPLIVAAAAIFFTMLFMYAGMNVVGAK
jgi:hypothetical protein